jgi:hypothetical protein
MTTLLLSSSSSQRVTTKKRLEKNFKRRREGAYLQARAFVIGLKLQAPLGCHFPKLPCISTFLSSPRSFDDGGEKKETKPGGKKMNLGLERRR